ncbi:MAG: hypothetical protein M3R65_07865 [Gemmatimonadota bacterium]|nr:hypothetical protein [Gemmatimonadota bacterium]
MNEGKSASWRQVALTLVAVLALGFAIGVTADRLWVMRSPPGPMTAAMLIDQMDRRVHLDSLQRAAITDVLRRHQTAIDSAWAKVRPSVHAVIDSSQREIIALLKPDQRSAYIDWIANAHRGMRPAGDKTNSRPLSPAP